MVTGRVHSHRLLLGGLIGLACASIGLLVQNARLRERIAIADARAEGRVAPGAQLSGFAAFGLDGPVEVDYGPLEKTRVFLYLSPTCRFCHEQIPHWVRVIRRLERTDYEIVVLARATENVGDVRDYITARGLGDLPVAFVTESIAEAYGLRSTPATIVVNGSGIVDVVWYGAWRGEALDEAVRFFDTGISGE